MIPFIKGTQSSQIAETESRMEVLRGWERRDGNYCLSAVSVWDDEKIWEMNGVLAAWQCCNAVHWETIKIVKLMSCILPQFKNKPKLNSVTGKQSTIEITWTHKSTF